MTWRSTSINISGFTYLPTWVNNRYMQLQNYSTDLTNLLCPVTSSMQHDTPRHTKVQSLSTAATRSKLKTLNRALKSYAWSHHKRKHVKFLEAGSVLPLQRNSQVADGTREAPVTQRGRTKPSGNAAPRPPRWPGPRASGRRLSRSPPASLGRRAGRPPLTAASPPRVRGCRGTLPPPRAGEKFPDSPASRGWRFSPPNRAAETARCQPKRRGRTDGRTRRLAVSDGGRPTGRLLTMAPGQCALPAGEGSRYSRPPGTPGPARSHAGRESAPPRCGLHLGMDR